MALTRVFKPPWSSSPVADPLGGDVPVPMSQDMIDTIIAAFGIRRGRSAAALHRDPGRERFLLVGTDAGEFIEIAGPAGTGLTGWKVFLYNGANGQVYGTLTGYLLSGTIPNQHNGFGTVSLWFAVNGLQNGAPDGFALVNATGQVIQFLSHEGALTAINGPDAQQLDHILVTGGPLDRANYDPVHLNAQLIDEPGRPTDHDPQLALLYFNKTPIALALADNAIPENSAAGTVVGTLAGSDTAGDTLTYALLNDADARFTVNATTGSTAARALIGSKAGRVTTCCSAAPAGMSSCWASPRAATRCSISTRRSTGSGSTTGPD